MNDHNSGNDSLTTNLLLAGLPTNEFTRLESRLENVKLNFGSIIYNLDARIDHVYFPNSGLISLLAAAGESATLEVGIVGPEGMAGLPLFLGVKQSRVKACRLLLTVGS